MIQTGSTALLCGRSSANGSPIPNSLVRRTNLVRFNRFRLKRGRRASLNPLLCYSLPYHAGVYGIRFHFSLKKRHHVREMVNFRVCQWHRKKHPFLIAHHQLLLRILLTPPYVPASVAMSPSTSRRSL